MKKNNFYVTDDHNKGYIFVCNDVQINALRKLFGTDEFCQNSIVVVDELGVFSVPTLRGQFSDLHPIYRAQWVEDNLSGFYFEFIDEDGVPYFSTCDGLELWRKDYYDWYSEVLRLNELIAELNAKIISANRKVERVQYEKSMALAHKKLNDMDYNSLDVVESHSRPLRLFRHINSCSDIRTAMVEAAIKWWF